MKKKILVIFATILAIILLLFAICLVGFGIASFKGYGISEGRVLITDNGSYMIIMDSSPIVMSNQSKNENIFEGLTNGDEIMIVHNGIQESYPGGTGVYYCKKLADGEYKDLPEQTLSSLGEMGWISTSTATQNTENFASTILRSYSTPNGIFLPQIKIIKSFEELNEYVKGFNNEFSKECEKYDERYFKEKSLIVVILEENSGSITHTVTDLKMSDDGKLNVYIDRNVPETGTCDMAYWHIFIEPDAEMTDDIANLTWYDVQLVFNGIKFGTEELVRVEKDDKMLSLIIPEGWEYATHETATETDDLAYTFFIEFWPEGRNEGSIMFVYDKTFGVCGTGLTSEEIILGGHTGSMGTYDNNPVWTFIAFDSGYHIWNYGADKWWNEYGTEAMEILDTLEYR